MCFNMLPSLFVILIYVNTGNTKLSDNAEQIHRYYMILKEKSIVSDFCKIEPELWASYCTIAVNHIAKESEEYEQMYLDYPAFTTSNDPNTDKCQDTKLFIPVINKLVDFKHLVCHGRSIIIRTDEPNEKFTHKISLHIGNTKKLVILEKVDEGKHTLLKMISTNLHLTHLITHELLVLPSPQSTFDKNIIKSKMGHAEDILDYEKNENHILRNVKLDFKKVCYMLFSRSEYEDEIKLLPKRKIRQIKKRPRGISCYLYLFENKIKFKVTMYSCPIFEAKPRLFKLIAGPDDNSVIVVKSTSNGHYSIPFELIENISLKFLHFQVRI